MTSEDKNDKVNEILGSLAMWEANRIYAIWTQLMSVTEGRIVVPKRAWVTEGTGYAYILFEKDDYSMVVYVYYNSKDINIEYRPPSVADYIHVRFDPSKSPSRERKAILDRFCEIQYTNETEKKIVDMVYSKKLAPRVLSAWRLIEWMSSGNLAIPIQVYDGVHKTIVFNYGKLLLRVEDIFCEIVVYKDWEHTEKLTSFLAKKDRQFGELARHVLTEAGIYKGE